MEFCNAGLIGAAILIMAVDKRYEGHKFRTSSGQ
jgi:hypothetical protein